ncbi:cytochrome P450 [Dactylosporangium sp. AC04546]|uniref:cytochrome P450 n=1 Tax=Dactylosporangium sp. AC04546 TaxID=2862460 RepID=UPI001EDFE02B|nr:cytochrome P450 [Dactylosporangium sp. AC04546]WVK79945.1 cytochrome P450 [Dactylosporangium sp. AC04546]
MLRDPATFSSAVVPRVPPRDRSRLAAFTDWSARWLFFQDPPRHTAERAPVTRALRTAPEVGNLARRLAARLPTSFDALTDFAHPIAAQVIAGLLCPPGAETEAFLARARALDRADADARDPVAREAGLTALVAATQAVREQLTSGAELAPVPRALRAAWPHDDDTAGAHSLMLLFAGVETTQNLIANAIHLLLADPARWTALAARPGTVEEAARLAPPVLGVLRRATRPATLSGVPVEAGTELVVMTARANRDPARFPDPDRFDPDRSPNPHLSFGLGPHYCPGAALTRLTAAAALAALREAFPRLTLAAPITWRSHDPIVHAPVRLPVAVPGAAGWTGGGHRAGGSG